MKLYKVTVDACLTAQVFAEGKEEAEAKFEGELSGAEDAINEYLNRENEYSIMLDIDPMNYGCEAIMVE
jgi:hypothetical protein